MRMLRLLALFIVITATAARADGYFVLGKNYQGGLTWSWSYNLTEFEAALSHSLEECSQKAFSCRLIARVRDGCFAFAAPVSGTGYGYSTGITSDDATRKAVRACRQAGNAGCIVKAKMCETLGPQLRAKFETDWKLCFDGSADACHQALSYFDISDANRSRASEQLQKLEQQARQQSEPSMSLAQQLASEQRPSDSARPAILDTATAAITEPADRISVGARLLRAAQTGDWASLADQLMRLIVVVALGAFVAVALATAFGPSRQTAVTFALPSVARPNVSATHGTHPIHNAQAAQEALELAQSYLQELDDLVPKVIGEPLLANTMLNTLSLASRQIAIAEDADPTAKHTFEQDGATLTVSISEMKSQALFIEAIARGADNPRRAIPILEKAAALNPTAALIYFWLGNFHGLLHDKRRAVEAYEKAVALEPKNLVYRKELDRARNMAWSQIAIAKSFRGARTAVNATRFAVILIMLGIIVGVFFTYGPGNVFFAILCIVGLGIGAKIHEWASR